MPFPVAVLCLFLNTFVPGLGTFVSAFTVLCGARTDLPDRHICCVFWLNIAAALIQILTAIVMVGWIMSIFWGMDMVILANHDEKSLIDKFQSLFSHDDLGSLAFSAIMSLDCFEGKTGSPEKLCNLYACDKKKRYCGGFSECKSLMITQSYLPGGMSAECSLKNQDDVCDGIIKSLIVLYLHHTPACMTCGFRDSLRVIILEICDYDSSVLGSKHHSPDHLFDLQALCTGDVPLQVPHLPANQGERGGKKVSKYKLLPFLLWDIPMKKEHTYKKMPNHVVLDVKLIQRFDVDYFEYDRKVNLSFAFLKCKKILNQTANRLFHKEYIYDDIGQFQTEIKISLIYSDHAETSDVKLNFRFALKQTNQ
ncbi:putative membrane protein C1orf95, partial [Ophiophagus hannah]